MNADAPTTTTSVPAPRGFDEGRGKQAIRAILAAAPVFIVLFGLFVWITIENPNFTNPNVFLIFLRRAAPLMILAAGQLFVIVSGEYDLSMGALITLVVILAGDWVDGDPARTWPIIAVLIVIGIAVGLVNGIVTTRLGVPSFITTLGMMLILSGFALWWSGGTPKGSLPDNFRQWGRTGIEGVPGINQLPWSVIITVVVMAIGTWLLHVTSFGKQVFATGGNPRAAFFSGVNVPRVRTLAFVISSVTAVLAGILLGGFSGVSPDAGGGYEFQAISAVVLGGAILGGGSGAVIPAMAGALALEALFTLLNLLGLPNPIRDVFQGVIIIGALGIAAFRDRSSR
jgi:ribose transport system permease protein